MSLRLMTCLILLCVSLSVAARDVQRSGPNGGGGTCPELVATGADETQVARAGKPAAVAPSRSEKPAVSRGGSDQTSVRPPRWHSFLPGMFR